MNEHIWILTREINQYDQDGAYFVHAWLGKPTFEQLHKYFLSNGCNQSSDFILHLLAGGGRQEFEYEWYLLKEQKE